MYVCICKGVTDTEIRDAVLEGATSVRAVKRETGAMSQCGKCACDAKEIIKATIAEAKAQEDSYYELA